MNSTKSRIYAGAAKICIKIPDNFFPYHGFNHRVLSGVHDDVFVRTAMIKNETEGVLFISVDTGDLSDKWLPMISKMSGLPEDNIFLTATHTHEAPYIDRTIPENVEDTEKTEQFIEQFKKAIAAAITLTKNNLVPARLGFGTGYCVANVNRDVLQSDGSYRTGVNPHGNTDHTVYIFKIEDLNGQPIAFINSYAVHSSIMLFSKVYNDGMLMSGDLAGTAMEYVEDQTGAVSLFVMGAAGDQGPLFSACEMGKKPDGNIFVKDEGEMGFALVRALGNLLGNEIVRAGKTIVHMEDSAAISAKMGFVVAPGQEKPEQRPGKPLPPDFEFKDSEPRILRLGLIKINDIAFAGIPGEIMNSIGADISSGLKSKGCKNTMIITQCNGSNSYMGDDEAYEQHKFAAIASYMKKGIAGILVKGILALYDRI